MATKQDTTSPAARWAARQLAHHLDQTTQLVHLKHRLTNVLTEKEKEALTYSYRKLL